MRQRIKQEELDSVLKHVVDRVEKKGPKQSYERINQAWNNFNAALSQPCRA
ncbi:MAG: hypothetical protein KGI83_04965 [Verrucomicrobiota bacterium]|nr:hypothetical protein [Verrucomicrobiota bacterium]